MVFVVAMWTSCLSIVNYNFSGITFNLAGVTFSSRLTLTPLFLMLLLLGVATAIVDEQEQTEWHQMTSAASVKLGWQARRSAAPILKQRLYINGDIVIGALFPVHKEPPRGGSHDNSVRACGEIWEQYGIHRVEAFMMALDRINSDPHMLPDVVLGCDVRDSCWDVQASLQECKHFIRTSLAQELDVAAGSSDVDSRCSGGGFHENASKPIAALLGAGSSSVSMQVQDMLQLFSIPQVDYAATSVDLSDKSRFRYFLRVAPPDSQQAMALVDLVMHFGWTYISTLYTDGSYGSSGMDMFNKLIRDKGICVAAAEHVSSVDSDHRYDELIYNMRKTPNAKVIVCFCEGATVNSLFRSMKRLGEKRFLVVGSDGWNTRPDVVKDVHDIAVGGLSIKMDSPPVPGFDNYFFDLTPENNLRNPWFGEFWEFKFSCSLPQSSVKRYNRTCTGKESLQNGYDVDAKLGFVMNAVYTMALGIKQMRTDICGSNHGALCDAFLPLNGSLLLQYLKKVNFTSYSNQALFFNENGDPPGKYLYMNYQLVNGVYSYTQVGSWEAGQFSMHDDLIQWRLPLKANDGVVGLPESVCSHPCAHGYIKKAQPQLSRCCWLCEKCMENATLTKNDTCHECPPGWWPDDNLTACFKLPITYIEWSDVDAALPIALASLGLTLAIVTLVVFALHNGTAVVKASTPELSYLMLCGIALAHVSTFAFVVMPTTMSCYATRLLPGLSFAAIYGSVLTKTNRIARILARSKKIIMDKPRCMTTGALVAITVALIGAEGAISAAMLVWQPAAAVLIYPRSQVVQLVCDTSAYGVLVPLAFDFLLILLCTFYAVKTRNVPANFNEAKFIGFAMYTTCVIWVGFVAVYFGSESKVMTMTLSTTLSASVALVLLFGQKLYIILWKPEKNNRSAFATASKDVRCHIGRAAASAATACTAKIVISANYPNGALQRDASSSSISSNSSRLVTIRQNSHRANSRISAGQLSMKRESRRYSAAGAPSPQSYRSGIAFGLKQAMRDEAEGHCSDADTLQTSIFSQRTIACQTDPADLSRTSADGATAFTSQSSGLAANRASHRRLSSRTISQESAQTRSTASGGTGELAVIEDEESQPLLEHTTVTSSSATVDQKSPDLMSVKRSYLTDVKTNHLVIASRRRGSGGDDPLQLTRNYSDVLCSTERDSDRANAASALDTLLHHWTAPDMYCMLNMSETAGAQTKNTDKPSLLQACLNERGECPTEGTAYRLERYPPNETLSQSKSWNGVDGSCSSHSACWDSALADETPCSNSNTPRSCRKYVTCSEPVRQNGAGLDAADLYGRERSVSSSKLSEDGLTPIGKRTRQRPDNSCTFTVGTPD